MKPVLAVALMLAMLLPVFPQDTPSPEEIDELKQKADEGDIKAQAYFWTSLAADEFEPAIQNLSSFTQQMTPEQIAEAQRLAKEWKPKGKR